MNIAGFEIISFAELKSTNDTAAEYAKNGAGQRLVITAQRQTAGRGRRGRKWQSLEGNLFFSVLLEFSLKNLGILVMASALGLLKTIKEFNPAADVQLKWPNDVLLNGAKVSGILLEKANADYMVVGVGVNIVQCPEQSGMLYPVISLQKAGIIATPAQFLQKYLEQFAKNILLDSANLRQEWLQNAKGVGQIIKIKQNGVEQTGIFAGIDENADLLLQTKDKIQKIMAGDVFYLGEENGRIG